MGLGSRQKKGEEKGKGKGKGEKEGKVKVILTWPEGPKEERQEECWVQLDPGMWVDIDSTFKEGTQCHHCQARGYMHLMSPPCVSLWSVVMDGNHDADGELDGLAEAAMLAVGLDPTDYCYASMSGYDAAEEEFEVDAMQGASG